MVIAKPKKRRIREVVPEVVTDLAAEVSVVPPQAPTPPVSADAAARKETDARAVAEAARAEAEAARADAETALEEAARAKAELERATEEAEAARAAADAVATEDGAVRKEADAARAEAEAARAEAEAARAEAEAARADAETALEEAARAKAELERAAAEAESAREEAEAARAAAEAARAAAEAARAEVEAARAEAASARTAQPPAQPHDLAEDLLDAARTDAAEARAAPAEAVLERAADVATTCNIDFWRGYRKAAFYARTFQDGEALAVAESPMFRASGNGIPEETAEAKEAYAALRERLEREGWQLVRTGETWFDHTFQLRVKAAAEAAPE